MTCSNRRDSMVRFSADIREIPHSNFACFNIQDDDDKDDAEKIWWTQNELAQIRRRSAAAIRNRQGLQANVDRAHGCTNEDCLRGLEGDTPKGKHIRLKNCQTSVFAVVEEQERRRLNNSHDRTTLDRTVPVISVDALAKVYSARTSKCQEEAYRMALVDENYVRTQVYEPKHHTCSSLSKTSPSKLLQAEIIAGDGLNTICSLCTCQTGHQEYLFPTPSTPLSRTRQSDSQGLLSSTPKTRTCQIDQQDSRPSTPSTPIKRSRSIGFISKKFSRMILHSPKHLKKVLSARKLDSSVRSI